MGENKKYILQNLDFDIPISFWVMYIDQFFGEEKAEEFYKYLIDARDIKRKNDIRNLMSSIGFSIYDLSYNEQLAFISIFKPFDTESKLVIHMENGVQRVFEHYSEKNMQLRKDIKKLGYSCEYTKFNWKDPKRKDTYQREYVFIIFSEEDTTIDTIEHYLSRMSGTKVCFNIPYEKNKTILNQGVDYLTMKNYYSKQKQEKVKNKKPYSFNSAMLRHALLNRFQNET